MKIKFVKEFRPFDDVTYRTKLFDSRKSFVSWIERQPLSDQFKSKVKNMWNNSITPYDKQIDVDDIQVINYEDFICVIKPIDARDNN